MNLFSFDNDHRRLGYNNIAGVDEAGRGPWAGPVVAATVILPENTQIQGLKDSKKLTHLSRQKLFDKIREIALDIGIYIVDHNMIDTVNILQATYIAMKGALKNLSIPFDLVLVDGWPIPKLEYNQLAITSGDSKSACIAAASIVAKVTRDKIMIELSKDYPQYNFAGHKGYGTKEHLKALKNYGPCPVHRKSFSPVKKCLGLQK